MTFQSSRETQMDRYICSQAKNSPMAQFHMSRIAETMQVLIQNPQVLMLKSANIDSNSYLGTQMDL